MAIHFEIVDINICCFQFDIRDIRSNPGNQYMIPKAKLLLQVVGDKLTNCDGHWDYPVGAWNEALLVVNLCRDATPQNPMQPSRY